MREILFRGKRKDNGEWVEGYYLELDKTTYCFEEDYKNNPDNTQHYIVHEEMTDWGLPNKYVRTDVIPETVGQYTGLMDRNGKKIFENDIIKYGDTLHKVVFENRFGNAYFGIVMSKNAVWNFSLLVPTDKMFVIGNIFDNPELIGGDAEG